jgi:hypothetical protein
MMKRTVIGFILACFVLPGCAGYTAAIDASGESKETRVLNANTKYDGSGRIDDLVVIEGGIEAAGVEINAFLGFGRQKSADVEEPIWDGIHFDSTAGLKAAIKAAIEAELAERE